MSERKRKENIFFEEKGKNSFVTIVAFKFEFTKTSISIPEFLAVYNLKWRDSLFVPSRCAKNRCQFACDCDERLIRVLVNLHFVLHLYLYTYIHLL